MISGSVNAYREAVIRVAILDVAEQAHEFDAVVDTGFSGSLTLPAALIASLELAWRNRGSAILANGTVDECDIYAGVAVWDGQHRPVLVEAAETDPLVGMRLMSGFKITIVDADGGAVTMERL